MCDVEAKIEVKADFTPITQGLGKNLESTPSGFRRIWNLIFGKTEAEIKYKQLLLAAQAEYDVNLILSGKARFEDGNLIMIDDRKNQSLIEIQNENKLKNQTECIKYALLESLNIESKEEINEENKPISSYERFFNRWRDEASNITNEDERKLWGKILAQKVKKHNTLSLKTLDILKNIDSESAIAFSKVCKSVINGNIILLAITNKESKNKYKNRLEKDEIVLLANLAWFHKMKLYTFSYDF